jgi:4-diphosphocytidyl-2-C-methyl-D-erythritol kinase
VTEILSTGRVTAHARAKVNLALEILHKRSDGYHEIETILQSVNLYDELAISFDESSRIAITVSDPDIPTDEGNTCYRAVEALRPLISPSLGAKIHIRKQIPDCSGLGGASSDAAAVILAANEAVGRRLPAEALEEVASQVGSDVPFMLYGGTMLGRGRGEILTRLNPLRRGFFLIVKPPVNISTASVYQDVNLTLTRRRYRINLKAVNTLLARFPNAPLTFRNALEDVVCPSYPLVSEALGELLASKPLLASMSGSGSALFGIYHSEGRASELAERFSVRGFFTAVVEPSLRAVELHPTESV